MNETRTVLLARSGEDAERLKAAMTEAGVEPIAVFDPLLASAQDVLALAPGNVVVLMDAEVEDALERFDDLLVDPSCQILFEEAALLRARDGWEAARWARHLAAKLQGHRDVLPAGHEPDDADGDSGGPAPEPATVTDADPAVGSSDAAEVVESVEGVEAGLPVEAMSAAPHPVASVPEARGLDAEVVEIAVDPADEAAALPASVDAGLPDLADWNIEFDADAIPSAPALTEENGALSGAMEGLETAPDLSDAPPSILDSLEDALPAPSPEAPSWISYEVDAAEVALPPVSAPDAADASYRGALAPLEPPQAAPDEAYEQAFGELERFDAGDAEDQWQDFERPVPEPPAPAPALAPGNWALTDEPLPSASPASAGTLHGRLEHLAERIAGLSLVDDDAPAVDSTGSTATTAGPEPGTAGFGNEGALVLAGGIGGPDPLRQILQLLPADFPVPVLVQQWLDAGHYDRLVRQMSRASRMPVVLAEAGKVPLPGHVHIVAPGLSLQRDGRELRFAAEGSNRSFADLLEALPAAASAIALLSGTTEDFVAPAMRFQQAGGALFAQAAEGCYDHQVPALLISRGAAPHLPPALATAIRAHWQTQEAE